MRRWRIAALLPAMCLMLAAPAPAQSGTAQEYQLKAAYLVNFARFVEWPANEAGELTMCVLGTDPFGPALDTTLHDLPVGGQRMVSRRLASVQDGAGCRVLFIAASEAPHLAAILAQLDGAPILTVSDIPQFARRGGMIQFVTDDQRVRFEVDLKPAHEAGLMLSSYLLRVATVVRPGVRQR